MSHQPPLQMFKVFESVARHGQLNAAARELHVTVGAVSHMLRSLQVHLGVSLFEKHGRRLVLTRKGELLSQSVARAMGDIADGVRQVLSSEENMENTTLRLFLPPILSSNWLCSRLFEFTSGHPNIQLEIEIGSNHEAIDWRKTEVAIAYDNPPFEGYWWRLIHAIVLMPVCSPQLLRGSTAIRQPSDLVAHRLLHEDDGSEWRRWLTLARLPFPLRSDIRFRDLGLVLQAAREGHGVALIDNVVATRDLDQGTLVQPLQLSMPASKNYHCICPPEKLNSPAVQIFINWLIDQCSGEAQVGPPLVEPD